MSNQRKQQPEKISADCPHCGFSQLESAYAKSTICRRCSQPFSIEKLLAKEVGSLKPPSFFAKVSKLISGEKIREVRCFSCEASQQVSSSAESTQCPKCGSYIDLRDFKISGPFGRSIQTQGEVIITSKADVSSARILCGEALLEGKLRGQLLCTGSVHVAIQGKLLGTIEASRIVIDKKAQAEFSRPLRAQTVEINGKAIGDIACDGKVTINKHGNLTGTIQARSITIEKGGIFLGDLQIGDPSAVQEAPAPPPEAAPAPPQSVPPAAASGSHLPGLEPAQTQPVRQAVSAKGKVRKAGAKLR